MKNRPIWRRFGFALAGLRAAISSEKSVRAHLVAIAAALVLLWIMRPRPLWWAVIIVAGGTMLAFELVNTAVEKLVDHLHPGIHPAIKTVKDTLAAAVLVACVAAAIAMLILLSIWV